MAELVPMNDLARVWLAQGPSISKEMNRVLESGWYVLGAECKKFENEFADYCGAKYCVGVGNGTDALEIAIKALDLRAGGTIAMVANAGGYAALAAQRAGFIPVFVDIDPVSRLMDLRKLDELSQSAQIDAVVVTHLYGLMHDMEEIADLLRSTDIKLIEDCAQAHGARRHGKVAGSFGDAGCFSFYPTKNLGCMGDGGAIITGSKTVAEAAIALRQYGWGRKYHALKRGGTNSRLDEIQAAVLNVRLPLLERGNSRRREIARRYSAEIEHERVVCPPVLGDEYVAHLYVVLCENRASLQSHLLAHGIASDIHYPVPDYRQSGLYAAHPDRLNVTEHLAERVLSLPCFAELRDDEVRRVIHAVNTWR